MDIWEENDAFRNSFKGGEVVFTHSFAELPDMVKASALQLVADYNDFTDDNDPFEDHAYGSFNHCNREFFFAINRIESRLIMTVGLAVGDW